MKLFNMFLVTAVAVALFALGVASAQQPKTTAYSVTDIQTASATDLEVTSYTATVSTTKNPKTTVGFPNGTAITISTVNCIHVPGKNGENGILVQNGVTTTLLFSSGATCSVKSITAKTL